VAEARSSLSNLVKCRQAPSANYVALDLERFVVPTRDYVGDPKLSMTGHAEAAVGGPVAENIGPIGAENTIRAAEAEAEAILNEARAQASEVLNEAKEQGFRLGKEEGAQEAKDEALKAAKADVASAVSALRKATSELGSVREKALKDNDTEMLGLVLGVTRLVLSREISTDKALILQQIRRAAEILGEADEVIVKLHPLDLKVAQRNVDDLVPEGKSMKLSIVADKSVEMGGCLLECDRGKVDARISTQLERIEAAFDEVIEQTASAGQKAPIAAEASTEFAARRIEEADSSATASAEADGA